MAKFAFNPDLLTELRATAGKTLVEASHNKTWGAGVLAEELEANGGQFEGDNLMGQILMRVRKIYSYSSPQEVKEELNAGGVAASPTIVLPDNLKKSYNYIVQLGQKQKASTTV